ANASSEVEFQQASAWLVGEEGRGVPQILEMGTMTRLDCALGTSGLMRQALALALNHTSQRMAFGKRLIEQPLMRNVLADLALESEASTALALLRALRKADAAAALAQELAPAKGAHPALDRMAAGLPTRVEEMATEVEARRLAQDVALTVQAALLRQHAPDAVFDAFCASRLGGDWGQAFGTLSSRADFDTILQRALPH